MQQNTQLINQIQIYAERKCDVFNFQTQSFDNTGLCGSEFQTHPFVPLF